MRRRRPLTDAREQMDRAIALGDRTAPVGYTPEQNFRYEVAVLRKQVEMLRDDAERGPAKLWDRVAAVEQAFNAAISGLVDDRNALMKRVERLENALNMPL